MSNDLKTGCIHAAIDNILEEYADDTGYIQVVHNYSGRGMYGAQCLAIIGDRVFCMQAISRVIKTYATCAFDQSVPESAFASLVDIMMDFNQDNMGHDVVIYWPEIQIEPLDEVDEDQEEAN